LKIGFTGTRHGMTDAQKDSFFKMIGDLKPLYFLHGDCIGADDDAAHLVSLNDPETVIVALPGPEKEMRAFNQCSDEVRPVKTHFARNRDIVDETDLLIATPQQDAHQPKGGTWYTVDYALKKGKRVVMIWPDGTVDQDYRKAA
jgi:hypothetical protein